jgi:hypothetical protein
MAKHGGMEGRMNRAEENIHKEPKAGGRSHSAGIGNERKADVRGAQEGGSAAEARGSRPEVAAHLGHAIEELHRQHPHHHMDRGPHHGGKEHIRHERLGGMKPHGGG